MRERIVAPPVCTAQWTDKEIERYCFRKIVEPEEFTLFGIKFRSTGKRDESGTLVYLADLNTPTTPPQTINPQPIRTMKTYSNRSFLKKIPANGWELIPSLSIETTGKFTDTWRPPVGEWFSVETPGIVGGGTFGDGTSDPGIPVSSGDRFRLIRVGDINGPSVWEVEKN